MAGLSKGAEQSKALQDNPKPDAMVVEDFHTNSDLDGRPEAQHHTLGPLPNQASPGPHIHDGSDSELLLSSVTLTGSRATDAWRLSIEAALVQLGAVSSSTP